MKAELIEQPIEFIPEIGDNTRLFNCLKRAGINTISDIILLDTERLENIKNFGKEARKNLRKILNKYNIIRIDEKSFDKEIMPYIEDCFPNYILDQLEQNIKDSDIENNLKQKLIRAGFITILELTTSNAKTELLTPEYDKVKEYLNKKNLINFEDKLYPYFIKKYKDKDKKIEIIEIDKHEINEKNQKLKEENEHIKIILDKYQPELKEYEKLKDENTKLLYQLRELKKSLKESKTLKKEIELNRKKIEEFQAEKKEIDEKILNYLNNEGLTHGTK